jgi:hypothetical protein
VEAERDTLSLFAASGGRKEDPLNVNAARTAGLAVLLSLASGMAAPAEAAEAAEEPAERAEALILGVAVNRFVAKQLPVTFQIRGHRAAGIAPLRVTLSEARYCGALDAGHGRLLGVLRAAGESSPGPTVLTGPHDCRDKPDEIVHRRPAGAEASAVVEIVAEWIPDQLRFSIGDFATSDDRTGALSAALLRAKAGGPFETIDTTGIRLETRTGASMDLELAISFVKAGDAILATLTPAGPARVGREPPPPSFLDPGGVSAGTDGIAGALFPLANRVAALFSQDGPLILDFEGQVVEVRALQISGSNGSITVRGRATLGAIQESVRLAIDAAGADLKIAEVRAEPELEDCAAAATLAALSCRAQNTARTAAVAAIASGMTARYRGQLLRVLLAPPPFSFVIGGRKLILRLTPNRARSTGVGLVVYGKADLD